MYAWAVVYEELWRGGPQTLDELTGHLPYNRLDVKGLLDWLAANGFAIRPATPDGKWQVPPKEGQYGHSGDGGVRP